MKILLVTNDFPPRVGGIQSYLWNIYRRLPDQGVEVRVLAPAFAGDAAFDARAPMEIVRSPRALAWPTRSLARRVQDLSRDADVVAFGAVLPMNLIAPGLDKPVVLHTHGWEVAWARVPGIRAALRRMGRNAAAITVVSEYTRPFIERAVGRTNHIHLLKTGVDLERFSPSIDTTDVRQKYGVAGRPLVTCISRLVPRKGQDKLIQAMESVRRGIPDAVTLIVGGGPSRTRLESVARNHGPEGSVVFTGEVPEGELPSLFASGDVFAMPCRSRYAGLEVEGLGLVYLEASACGRPVIAGDSGGAPEAVIAGETGLVVPGRDVHALARALTELLGDAESARAMGLAGREFVEREHDWSSVVARFRAMLPLR
jgi:phosphatidylinositol alpha-1,6-mannosyltransferase